MENNLYFFPSVRLIYNRFDLQLPLLAPNIIFCFSNHQGAVFLFALPLLPSCVFQWQHEEGNFFLIQIQLAFLHRILFRSVLFSPLCSRTSSLVTFSDHFIFSILVQHHISKLFKYKSNNF